MPEKLHKILGVHVVRPIQEHLHKLGKSYIHLQMLQILSENLVVGFVCLLL